MELLTVREAALLLKVNPITIRRYIQGGRLPAVRVGRKGVRVHKEALDKLQVPIEAQEADQASEGSEGKEARPGGARQKVLTYDDPLWELVGSATDAPPTDASRKHAYLAEDEA